MKDNEGICQNPNDEISNIIETNETWSSNYIERVYDSHIYNVIKRCPFLSFHVNTRDEKKKFPHNSKDNPFKEIIAEIHLRF